jgi:hypothetical protein
MDSLLKIWATKNLLPCLSWFQTKRLRPQKPQKRLMMKVLNRHNSHSKHLKWDKIDEKTTLSQIIRSQLCPAITIESNPNLAFLTMRKRSHLYHHHKNLWTKISRLEKDLFLRRKVPEVSFMMKILMILPGIKVQLWLSDLVLEVIKLTELQEKAPPWPWESSSTKKIQNHKIQTRWPSQYPWPRILNSSIQKTSILAQSAERVSYRTLQRTPNM